MDASGTGIVVLAVHEFRNPIPNTGSKKIVRNRARHTKVRKLLRSRGWEALTIWECEIVHKTNLLRRVVGFLGA